MKFSWSEITPGLRGWIFFVILAVLSAFHVAGWGRAAGPVSVVGLFSSPRPAASLSSGAKNRDLYFLLASTGLNGARVMTPPGWEKEFRALKALKRRLNLVVGRHKPELTEARIRELLKQPRLVRVLSRQKKAGEKLVLFGTDPFFSDFSEKYYLALDQDYLLFIPQELFEGETPK